MDLLMELATVSGIKAELVDLLESIRSADDYPKELVEQKLIEIIRSTHERESFLLQGI